MLWVAAVEAQSNALANRHDLAQATCVGNDARTPRRHRLECNQAERLVTEASEHVLRFDWDDIALRTRGTYGELRELSPREEEVHGG